MSDEACTRNPCRCLMVIQEFKGYIFKIMGGNDKQGFGMKQGVLTNGRVFLLMSRCAPDTGSEPAYSFQRGGRWRTMEAGYA